MGQSSQGLSWLLAHGSSWLLAQGLSWLLAQSSSCLLAKGSSLLLACLLLLLRSCQGQGTGWLLPCLCIFIFKPGHAAIAGQELQCEPIKLEHCTHYKNYKSTGTSII